MYHYGGPLWKLIDLFLSHWVWWFSCFLLDLLFCGLLVTSYGVTTSFSVPVLPIYWVGLQYTCSSSGGCWVFLQVGPCHELNRNVIQDHQWRCTVITVYCEGQGIIPFELTTMHELCHSQLQEIVNIFYHAIAFRVVRVAVDSLYT